MAYKAPKASSKFWLLYLLQRVMQRLARGVSRCALQKTLCPGILAYHRHIKYVYQTYAPYPPTPRHGGAHANMPSGVSSRAGLAML